MQRGDASGKQKSQKEKGQLFMAGLLFKYLNFLKSYCVALLTMPENIHAVAEKKQALFMRQLKYLTSVLYPSNRRLPYTIARQSSELF